MCVLFPVKVIFQVKFQISNIVSLFSEEHFQRLNLSTNFSSAFSKVASKQEETKDSSDPVHSVSKISGLI